MKQLPEGSHDNISSTVIAAALRVNDVQVRKDLALLSDKGKPKTGYITKELIADLEHFLGYTTTSSAVLIGAGNLGKALLEYKNFEKYGLKIVAAFDNNPELVGRVIGGIKVIAAADMEKTCRRLNVHIGIIAVPERYAQEACDKLVSCGMLAVWNFAPVNLATPEGIIVRNEDMASSLSILTKQLDGLLMKR